MEYELKGEYLYIDIKTIHEKTINEFLENYIYSKKYRHLLIQNKWLMIDDRYAKREDEIVGDKLIIRLYPEIEEKFIKTDKRVKIVYEDELCLIVYKPKGILVHDDGNNSLTLSDMVSSYMKENDIKGVAHPIQRLDIDTQGLVFFSKSVLFEGYFDKMLEYKQLKRYYMAIVSGRLARSMTIDEPIAKDRHNNKRYIVYKGGKSAKTLVKPIVANDEYSILDVELKSGRTHQIRVHLSYMGYPILNDKIYGVYSNLINDMGLIAYKISFYSPLKEEMLEIETELPNDIKELLNETDKD